MYFCPWFRFIFMPAWHSGFFAKRFEAQSRAKASMFHSPWRPPGPLSFRSCSCCCYTKVHGGYSLALRRNRGYLNQTALVDLCEAPVTRYLVSRWELLLAANLILDSRAAYLDGRQVPGDGLIPRTERPAAA